MSVENEKYIFIGEPAIKLGHTLHRIQAVRDFGDVHKGDLGGWIESKANLDHYGDSWVYDDSLVYGDADIRQDASVRDHAIVSNGIIKDEATAKGFAWITGPGVLGGNAVIGTGIVLEGTFQISGDTRLSSTRGCANIREPVRFTHTPTFYTTVGPIGSRHDTATFYICADDSKIWVETGCFVGTIEQFVAAVRKRYFFRCHSIFQEYMTAVKTAKLYLKRTGKHPFKSPFKAV